MEQVVLGAHDGVMAWTVRIGAERSPLEQQLVSLHERRHHDLHQSSPWGLLMAFLAATRGPRGLQDPVWRWVAEGCRTVHESFATYFSVTADARFLDLLAGNATYLAYQGTAAALLDWLPVPAQHHNLMIDALLRSMMAPRRLCEMSADHLVRLRLMDLQDDIVPDTRLAALTTSLTDPSSDRLLAALAHVDDRPGLAAFRSELARALTQLGLPTMTVEEHRGWATNLIQRMNAAGTGRFQLVDGPEDPVTSAMDDFQRERLRLFDRPLPLRLVSPSDAGWEMSWLARGHEGIGPHAWLVWMRGDLFRQQFTVPDGLFTTTRPVLGFLAVDRVHGPPVARLWHFSQLSPATVAEGLRRQTNSRVLFFTTLATIMDSDDGDDFRGIDPAFALIDQSLIGFLDHTRERGARLSWRAVRLRGGRELAVLVMAQDHLPEVYFLVVASLEGYKAFLAWLLRQPSEVAAHDPTLADGHRGHLDALLEHLAGSFWEIHLFAGTPA
jgi:hypothetical protein